jgi:ParB-like chromosome segregation protein Spo0J
MARSISELGLIRPPLVAQDASGRPIVISGGRRLMASLSLGLEAIACLAPGGPRLAALAISENLDRGLNPAETALAWELARQAADEGERRLIASMLALSAKRLPALEAAASLGDKALEAMAKGALDLENAQSLAALADSEREAVLALILEARASRQNRRRWLEWLADLKRSSGKPLTALVKKELSPLAQGPEAERRVSERLSALRLPGVARLRAKRRAMVKSLKLPEGLKLELDPELEDVKGEVRLSFDSASELRGLAEAAIRLSGQLENEDLWLEGESWPPK